MAVSPSPDQLVSGRVVTVNSAGLKLAGHVHWMNFSKYARDLILPMRGQSVVLNLDRQGFIRAVETQDDSEVTPTSRTAPGATTARETTITRLAVLKAAAEFAASRPQVKSGELLKIAASWVRWVNRPAGDDLADAF